MTVRPAKTDQPGHQSSSCHCSFMLSQTALFQPLYKLAKSAKLLICFFLQINRGGRFVVGLRSTFKTDSPITGNLSRNGLYVFKNFDAFSTKMTLLFSILLSISAET